MKKFDALTIVKGAVFVVGVGVTLAQSIIAGKELDSKVAEKVAEALENK